MLTILLLVTTAIAVSLALFFGYRLYTWERALSRSRMKVYFKNRTAMTPRLLDLVIWSRELQKDKAVNGQMIYKQGGTTIALTRAHKRVPKPKDQVIKENNTRWRRTRADSQHGSQQPKEGRLTARLGTKPRP